MHQNMIGESSDVIPATPETGLEDAADEAARDLAAEAEVVLRRACPN
jgi:hypothetical protein